jgi:DNA-binding beta-propeller fold protein YncE
MDMSRRLVFALVPLVVICVAMIAPIAQRSATPPTWPGAQGGGVTLLPNGWRLAPAGRSLYVGDFPIAMTPTPDGRQLVVMNAGWSRPSLTVVDVDQMFVRARVPVDHAWLGLAWNPAGTRLYASGAAQNVVNVFRYEAGALSPDPDLFVDRPAIKLAPNVKDFGGTGFIGGLAVSADGRTVYAVHVLGRALSAVETATGAVRTVPLPAEGYAAALSQDGHTLFVSIWGGARVLAFDAASLVQKGEVAVGEHPNALALSKDGARLFVACANTNRVWVIDTASLTAREQISVSLYPDAPAGSTPSALAVSPDGRTLAVANADNNVLALADIERPGASVVSGFIPTGWYPTAVLFDREGKRLFVLSGKGLTGQANPRGPTPGGQPADGQYIGQLLQGALSVIPVPSPDALRAHTQRAMSLSPYNDATKLAPANAPAVGPIPRRVGESSPITHVFYVIRENRTYDQVLGDLDRGNGDPSLTLFGDDVTPNAHALARQFVTFDNFYVDAEVSYDGHAFSTSAYATDVSERIWPTDYGQRVSAYLSEGGFGDRNAYGNLSAPPDGYLWDAAKRKGVSVRTYGEFVEKRPDGTLAATVPGLRDAFHPTYPPWDLNVRDNQRVDVWLEEFQRLDRSEQVPRLSIIRIGNDHTLGTRIGAPTPRSMVAENDVALGRLVEAISASRVWKESAIFVVEDDSQNGPDHVDSHRSVALVASPFAKRGVVDSTLYTTSSVLRTMELILGLPPLSQYDAGASPMYNAFQPAAVQTPFAHLPARVPLDERNRPGTFGAAASAAMNFAVADRTPEYELNEIIWKSVRGAASPMPPPVRAAFVHPMDEDDDEKAGAQATEREDD